MRMKYVAQLVVKSVMGPMEFVGLGKRCVQVMPYLPYGWRIWPVRKCHFAYMWQIVGGVIPSNCGICTPEVAFPCYDLPHISEMEVFISCNLPHISEMKCVSLLRVQWSRPVRTAAPRYLYARRQSMAVYVG